MSKNLRLHEFLLDIYSKTNSLNREELYSYFLEQAIQLSGSSIGFFHEVSEDQKTIMLTTWSQETLKTCTASYDNHSPIEKAGNWADCIRTKTPVICNDFAASPNQKGFPKGHVKLERFMAIPVVEEGKIKLVFGVGNKAEPYQEADCFEIELVAKELLKILKQRSLEEALAKSEAKYHALVENADDAILLSDLDGNVIYRNPAYFSQLGFVEGSSQTFAKLHPDDLPTIRSNKAGLLKTGFSTSQYRVKHSSGVWVYRLAKSTLLHDKKRQPYAILSVIRDITEQKQREQEARMDKEKITAMNEKLKVIGGLTRHDVRNKLSVFNGYAYLLKKKYPDEPDIVQTLSKMEHSINDSVAIFDFAKTYEQIGVEELSTVDVEKAVNDAKSMFSNLPFDVVNGCAGLTVLADSLMTKLIYNLIDNTRKYGQKTTKVRVYFEEDKENLFLIYEDDGVGIQAANKPKLFTKGFSTGGSSGFGLFLCKKIIDVYGWTIQENGHPGQGARFVIKVPRKEKTSGN